MHKSTMVRMKWFVDNYVVRGKEGGGRILDVGSYDVNGSYKRLFDGTDFEYVGLDIEAGPNVDIVMESPYEWNNIKDEEFDYIISGQAFEHIEFPWLTMEQIYKKLKPGGIICIIAPNTATEHRYPLDCYRYFSDGLVALAKWAGFIVLDVSVAGIPSRNVSADWDFVHNDACLIALKGSLGTLEGKGAKLSCERRIYESDDLTLQYQFMYRWIRTENREKILNQFWAQYNVDTVYIFGYEYLGRLLHEELIKNSDIKVEIIVEVKEKIKFEENSILILSLLDANRDFRLFLESVYSNVPIFYIDEIFLLDQLADFLEKDKKKVYIYGAGIVGKSTERCLVKLGYEVEAFLVSDRKRRQQDLDGIKILEIGEIKNKKKSTILVAVKDKFYNDIVQTLTNYGFVNFRCI